MAAIERLRAFDRLVVGAPVLQPRRIAVPYTVLGPAGERTFDVSFSWEEAVFAPHEPGARNLASLIGAQIALNYGLFCDEIEFHGAFDAHDRAFLGEMAENTAREIYVKKFLEPNPFLLDDARDLRPEAQERYCRAQLVFPDEGEEAAGYDMTWSSVGGRIAVLSSGGKDSLLSYGLLREMGWDVHPIYGNESGRHWFTALTAYRHFRETVPNTARVWMNSDRAFSWMLRQLPFVRPDFSNVRSDEYPIRLWTVAVFLFGALPLLRKRGIGHLVIGDEFDTSDRQEHEGIPHYNGLYDQSIWFDNALSAWYRNKGWALNQFSMLRPLSELLIEKTLAERYPDLLSRQVSCHATHKEDYRIRPCGRCEKCRRIVAMLLAVDADPELCGYSAEQMRACLDELTSKGVHQEGPGVQQLHYMLAERGLLEAPDASPRAEVLQLRFDDELSPITAVPRRMRRPLYGLLLRHADGAVRAVSGAWEPFDLLADPRLEDPHPWEWEPEAAASSATTEPDGPRPWVLGDLTWPDAEKRFKEVDLAILPVGALEQHGPHLPLDTDAWDAGYLALEVAARCSEPRPIVLPLLPYGVSYHHDDFPGTISITNDSLSRMVYDIGIGLARNGIRKLVIINGHGGNDAALNYAAQQINRDTRMFVCVDTGETSDADVFALSETQEDLHAGEIETSTSLALRPHLVRMDLAQPSVPEYASRYLESSSRHGISWHAYTKRLTESGVMGDPTKASLEKGQKMWEVMIRHLVRLVEDIKPLSPEELYPREY